LQVLLINHGEWVAPKVMHNRRSSKVATRRPICHKSDVTAPTSVPSPLEHDERVKPSRIAQPVSKLGPAKAEVVRVLVAESGPLQSQLLTRALRSRRDLQVFSADLNTGALDKFLQSNKADVVLIAGSHLADLSLLRWLHISYPRLAPVVLIDKEDRDQIVNALRTGARGIFLFTQSPFRSLCKCIHCVSRGEIWLNNQHTGYMLGALSEGPMLRVVNANGRSLLTPREEQVVALVADGMSNRDVAGELGLSEHTVKKYLLRIFDKLGISSRVELVLYAMSHGENRPAEWMPSSA
jgi:DNA-binding NarL/FixJ family response regulator